VLQNLQGIYSLHFDAEQMPVPDSRVYLDSETDELGLPRLVVDWKLSEDDVQSVIQSIKIVAAELERTGTGSMNIDDQTLAEEVRRSGVGSHHFGLTRMSTDPQDGVVDRNCQVFGVDNLYIASPSTFPTSGVTNPALGTMAFAIRLGDYLKQEAATAPTSS
jgi:choline dehydrogenase-like flavoprotein